MRVISSVVWQTFLSKMFQNVLSFSKTTLVRNVFLRNWQQLGFKKVCLITLNWNDGKEDTPERKFLVKCVSEVLVKWHLWVCDIPLSFCRTRRLHYMSQHWVVIIRHVSCCWRKVQIYMLRKKWVLVCLWKQGVHVLRSMWSHFKERCFPSHAWIWKAQNSFNVTLELM